ncbi:MULTISPECIES: RNA polymerase factor sigma-54 [unclassified Lysinibacillus]|uniref:RNA polymerase factor sigma-54 n=1 Tax=unclassified Lysinibacillus TaxID=2636778 RepID=UPI00131F0309|nr:MULTISPECIES: RNA polymerase factor sigma-54 [unclassified Lysinibacillus]
MQMDIQISPQIKQIMTMDTIFHLEILQLTNDELATMIADKALENPLLLVEDHFNRFSVDYSNLKRYDNRIEPFKVKQESVVEYLWELMPLQIELPNIQERVLRFLMEHLDEHLFLQVEISEVCKKFSISEEEIIECIELLQSFGPFGIASKNSKHFLELQVNLDEQAPPFALLFIQQELTAIANLQMSYLMKKYKMTKKEVLTTIAYIKGLQPFPKMPTLNEPSMFIIPDLQISLVAGQWIIEINNQLLPKVSINEGYIALLKEESLIKDYVEQQLKQAQLLVDGIEERKKTIYRIMNWLIQKQRYFLEKGQSGLIPLRLADAARELNLHESTISRAIRNKYVRTPFGMLMLKEFFPKGITYTENPNLTSDRIKQRIQQLIAGECSSKPLSDQQLVEFLKKEQILISRRTVAKYRESLTIPNSTKRAYA